MAPNLAHMIIDSGWDFVLLTSSRLDWNDPEARRLFVVAMDRDLGYYFTKVVDEQFDGDLAAHAERIVDSVDEDFIRYFATVEQVPQLNRNDSWGVDCEGDLITRALAEAGEMRGLHHISHLQLDPTMWHSTGPMHSFRDYHRDDLPKFDVTRPPMYDGWRRSTKQSDVAFLHEIND